jgi:energy-converting hydrogenase B subunit D
VNVLLALILTLVAFSALVVVLIREPARQAIALGVFGLLEAVMFFVVQAPDVAFSQITVGGVAVPAMLFLAITKIRTQGRIQKRESETSDEKQQ